MKNKTDVAIIVGSKSDLVLIRETIRILNEFELAYNLNIASAHRTVDYLRQCIKSVEATGVKVFIAAAGMSAALPGIIAAETIFPVIGIPVASDNLSNLDSLFSIVQMPKGVPVATVAVGKSGAVNAALLAIKIMAVGNDDLKNKLKAYKTKMMRTVMKEDLKLQKIGIEKYIKEIDK
ncbi:MAG: 5-(carboxyamino)imidazole ribonucleotide mutase [Endomicrobium sp.]|jgi:5-(carboxyamino)imidazole ribonucleotide mutase|nr:5-(carboxyamino)imidazole ribonucleotide mutase [Endomicrobium sp.]